MLVHLQPIKEALCVDDVLTHFNFSSLSILSLCPDFHGLLVCTDKDTNLFLAWAFALTTICLGAVLAYHFLYLCIVSV